MRTRSPIGKTSVALATLAVAGGTLVLAVLAMLVGTPTTLAFGAVRVEPAAANTPCVAVLVDFRLLGGTVQTGCAQGDPSTGLKALSLAGFSWTPRRDGLICQIDSHPACTDTTSSKYWSYWYRAAGSTHWVYATEGPGSHHPKPGSTEGWVWQDGDRKPPPGTRAATICPQLVATPSPKPTKTKPTSPKPTGPVGTTPSTAKKPAPGAETPSSPGSTSAGRSPSGATASPATSTRTSSSGAATPPPPSARPPTEGSASGAAPDPVDQGGGGALGGLAGVTLGGAAVVGIGAATVIRARRGKSP